MGINYHFLTATSNNCLFEVLYGICSLFGLLVVQAVILGIDNAVSVMVNLCNELVHTFAEVSL